MQSLCNTSHIAPARHAHGTFLTSCLKQQRAAPGSVKHEMLVTRGFSKSRRRSHCLQSISTARGHECCQTTMCSITLQVEGSEGCKITSRSTHSQVSTCKHTMGISRYTMLHRQQQTDDHALPQLLTKSRARCSQFMYSTCNLSCTSSTKYTPNLSVIPRSSR